MTRLKALKPAIDAAIAAPGANPDIKLRFSEAAVFARKKEFEPANELLDRVEALLKSAIPAAPPPPSDAAVQFMTRLKALKPAIDAAIAAPGANPDIKLRFSEAAVFARKKEFDQANLLLDRVEKLLPTNPAIDQLPPESSGKQSISLVKLGKARIEWDGVRSQALKEIQRLKDLLQEAYGDDQSEQQAHSTAMQRLDSTIASMNEELGDRLDDVLNAEALQRPKVAATAKLVLERFISFVESDQLMSLIDGNEYAPDMLVAKPLRANLKEIVTALA